ncbi:AAA family ATPase [Amycolatopsis sp. CA-230715]|uniref:AAA family ATPase n=1 Tax=Amycolatopsis sp. CA-230715 TaxID=2745196 RepID=UPI001C02C48D|nr:AAA family ATPase [Amycolatopsis sp. CA-230715]
MNDAVRKLPVRRARRRSMADRVRLLRHQGFVGRVAQRRLFASALRGDPDAPRVLFVHGPGGIGKSALLRRLADDAEDLGHTVAWVSGEYVLASTTAFTEEAAPVETADRPVLVVDGFEHCQVLETWLREHFLPTVPEDTVVVVAGRRKPEPNWTLDPGWRQLVRAISLEPLTPDEVADLLDERGVPGSLHSAVNGFAGGHPLALCLAAETATSLDDATWAPSPDVIETLLARLIDRVPSPAHEYGLRVCAHVRHVTVDLLRTGLGEDDAVAVFDWLGGLPYVEPGPHGLAAHELVRDVLDSSFKWRDPAAYSALHARMWQHLGERAQNASGDAVPVASSEITYLFRYTDYVREDIVDVEPEALFEREYAPAEREDLLRLAREDQGDEYAARVAYWLDRRPEAFQVYCRAADMVPVSFFAWLRLRPGSDDLTADPALAPVKEYLDRTGGVNTGEHVGVARFLVPAPSTTRYTTAANAHSSRISTEQLRYRDGLVASFLVLPDAEGFAPKLEWFDYRLYDSIPALGDGNWGVFVHDWREIPLPAHLERIMPRIGGAVPGAEAARAFPSPVAMTQEQHFEAVKQLLRDWHDEEVFAANPLVRVHRDAAALREAVLKAVEELAGDPRRVNHHRALRATYLERATTQEAAAARLGMPFGTYRRHLRSGTREVCAILWAAREGRGSP